jgi:hypothetical protein
LLNGSIRTEQQNDVFDDSAFSAIADLEGTPTAMSSTADVETPTVTVNGANVDAPHDIEFEL